MKTLILLKIIFSISFGGDGGGGCEMVAQNFSIENILIFSTLKISTISGCEVVIVNFDIDNILNPIVLIIFAVNIGGRARGGGGCEFKKLKRTENSQYFLD